jgi:hypothetical protein
MSFYTGGERSVGTASVCHVCHKILNLEDCAVEHDGTVAIDDTEKYGHIIMHTPCATILAMRLINDVMKQKTHPRVVNTLLRSLKHDAS